MRALLLSKRTGSPRSYRYRAPSASRTRARPRPGAAKRLFSLTPEGRAALHRWIDALACYMATIQELREDGGLRHAREGLAQLGALLQIVIGLRVAHVPHACYMATIQELREEAADALGIPVPPRPVCGGHE